MGMATVDAYKKAMKTVFITRKTELINYDDHPTLAMMPKSEDFDGFDQAFAVQFEDPQGVSAKFAVAQANKEPSVFGKFTPTRKKLYGFVSLSNELIRASERDVAAFVKAKVMEAKRVQSALVRRLAWQQFGDGSGRIGKVSSITSNVITLTNPEDVVFFAKNMYLEASANDGSAATHALYSGRSRVTKVDAEAGKVTVDDSTTINPGTGLAANDFLFPEGDFRAAFNGFGIWIPITAPASGDSFLGQDRTDHITRLSGIRMLAGSTPSMTGLSIAEKLKKTVARLKRETAKAPEYFVMNDDRYAELEIEMESRKIIEHVESPHAGIGFDVMVVHAGGSKVKVLADHNCPDDKCYGLRMDVWKLCSLGALPGLLTPEELIVEATADGFESRFGGYGDNICFAPGHNSVTDLDA